MSGACLKACGYPLRACEWAGEGGEGGEEADDDSGGGGGGGGGDGGDGGGGEGATGQLQVPGCRGVVNAEWRTFLR